MTNKKSAPRNKTIEITKEDSETFGKRFINLISNISLDNLINKTINQDIFKAIEFLPDNFIDLLFIDLLFIDPPYNMNKKFGVSKFKESSIEKYTEWLDNLISKLDRCIKPTASIYICGDWKSSTSIHQVMEKYFIVRK